MAYQPQQGVFDKGYMDFLNGLSQPDLADRASSHDPMVRGTATDYNTLQAIKGALGRDPTADEFAAYAPMGTQAAQLIAQHNLSDPNRLQKQYESQAGNYSGDINSVFNDLLKRGATQDEVNHFGTLIASGQIDPYELRSFVQATPEYQTNQDTAFRSGLTDELTAADTKAFGQQKEDVISRFAGMGRTGSTALDFALTDLMGKIADKRQGFLANLSATQYQGNKDSARSDYANTLNTIANNNSTNNSINDEFRQRGWNVQDYNTQKNDYLTALGKQKNGTPWWQVGLGAAGAGVGGYFGGPAGAKAGWDIGSGVGRGVDYSTM